MSSTPDPPPMDDPLDPRCVLVDIVELLSSEVLTDRKNRIERSNQLNYFLERLGGNIEHSRLYSRVMMASVMFEFCARDPYRTGYEGDYHIERLSEDTKERRKKPGDPVFEGRADFTPLSELTVEKWEGLLAMFQNVRQVLVRADANKVIIPQKIREFPSNDKEPDSNAELPSQHEDTEEVNEAVISHGLFTTEYERTVRHIRFQQSLGFFRSNLEAALNHADDQSRGMTHIQPNQLVAFEDFVTTHFKEDDAPRECLESLLIHSDKSDRQTRSCGLSLKSVPELKCIVQEKKVRNFDLNRFQSKVEDLLLKWNELVLTKPKLLALGYGRALLPPLPRDSSVGDGRALLPPLPQDSSVGHGERASDSESGESSEETGKKPLSSTCQRGKQQRTCEGQNDGEAIDDGVDETSHQSRGEEATFPEVETLARARQTLTEGFTDPLDECRAVAAEAAGASASTTSPAKDRSQKGKTSKLYDKKASAKKVVFTDSSADESEEEGIGLSDVPKPPKTSRAQASSKKAHAASSFVGVRKRKRFTQEEKSAIKIGVERFGFGRWAQIKDYYKEELRNRTSVNIKDCYRTMMKNNEV